MAVIIGNARIDENGDAHGGAAGDSTGREVCTQNWYAYPWSCVIRPKSSAVAEAIAQAMEYACKNDNIGYDQYQRTDLYNAVKKIGFSPASVSKVGKCETDCSALVSVCVNCAGISVSQYIYTGNEATALMDTGKFQKLTDSKYLISSDYLKRGDILINTVHHTAIVLSNGSKASAASSATSTSSTASSTTTTTAKKESDTTVQKWKNGKTTETVYQTSACTESVKIGSLAPYESCYCYGVVNGAYLVAYKLDNAPYYKCGYVKYSGGTSF